MGLCDSLLDVLCGSTLLETHSFAWKEYLLLPVINFYFCIICYTKILQRLSSCSQSVNYHFKMFKIEFRSGTPLALSAELQLYLLLHRHVTIYQAVGDNCGDLAYFNFVLDRSGGRSHGSFSSRFCPSSLCKPCMCTQCWRSKYCSECTKKCCF